MSKTAVDAIGLSGYAPRMPDSFDVGVIGGGISGISLAARLAPSRKVVVVEAEEHLGAHATGRSAALLVEAYGPSAIRQLTALSRAFFERPPENFSEAPLARPRGALIYSGAENLRKLREEFDLARTTTTVEWLDADAVLQTCPILRPAVADAGFLESGALDLDTNALLAGFARLARSQGAEVSTGKGVVRIEQHAEGWRVATGGREILAQIVVNAAGAWADVIAEMAGVRPRKLQPKRRTAATLSVPTAMEAGLATLPFAAPVDNSYYFKPEARAIMVSLCDETPSDPCDAWPDDMDVASALDRFHQATIVPEVRPIATWAGLRTFAPDGNPIVGFDPQVRGFFWYAGQGGYGIQTSPALSSLAAKLIVRESLSDREAELATALRPGRPQLSEELVRKKPAPGRPQ